MNMTLFDHIRRAMPVHTVTVRMSHNTRMTLLAERSALAAFVVGNDGGCEQEELFGHPVSIDNNVPPLTVVFETNGRNYRFGWSA